ncbi:vitelline membrane outer layer protein 1-like isoform X2 [Myxocyprinus asiaticus]|uniref:vitelline membrane outer layer protein 1-like isoform X2 n=1 Tax=Myxocyprinus asiaticus TaxID=70543 RepID=UPI0022215B4B|nr:vitelline membrane outer layer protein 1-like isoform X2 [Myxocyprinus asiaticus]
MYRFLSMTVISLLVILGPHVSIQSSSRRLERSINRMYISVLKVSNGMRWGTWGLEEMCPTGTYAAGFSLKVERNLLPLQDDTALNGIRLHCIDPSKNSAYSREHYSTVQSEVGSWGTWTNIKWCSSGFLKTFQLRVESSQGGGDDTAANNIRFTCSENGEVLEGSGMSWGDWGDWSNTCPGKGICGIKTSIEEPQHSGDDTALNDVMMYCCK